MNAILYGFPAFSGWAVIIAAFLFGFFISSLLWFPLGKFHQRTKEPKAWKEARHFQNLYQKECLRTSNLKARLNIIKMALEEKE